MGRYDVVVIGGGHAGIEAGAVAARMGMRTLIITLSKGKIGELSCNPSMGGIAKANLIRDIDMLGGLIGYVTDRASVSYRILNRRKGPAVQATRAQVDRRYYRMLVQCELFRMENIDIIEDEAIEIEVESDRVRGVVCDRSGELICSAVIVATGTFLNGLIHIGHNRVNGGRMGERNSSRLVESLRKLGLRILRFKTGTPPRVYKSSINLAKMIEQKGETDYIPFSVRTRTRLDEQLSCFLTYTTERTKRLILENLSESALYGGRIKGIGPRYCPSIEDKVVKYADHERHQIFIEPEGWNSELVYLNGLSMSMPYELQLRIVQSVIGLEEAKLAVPAYAIEYDLIDPKMLTNYLQYKYVKGLFFAGQVNGSSGYEEASAQGIMAGINAALYVKKEPPFRLERHESYIGVMIDDLVLKGVDEPYRLFTARAEHRLILREDNTSSRLLKYAEKYKLLPENMIGDCEEKDVMVKKVIEEVKKKRLGEEKGGKLTLEELAPLFEAFPKEVLRRALIELQYEGYIEREKRRIRSESELQAVFIPDGFDYGTVRGLTREGKEKFIRVRPKNLLEALKIPGIRLSDITLLYIHLKRKIKGDVSYETPSGTR